MKIVWHEDNEFWESWAPFMFTEGAIKSASTDVEAIIKLLGLHEDCRILDLCCGIGRHSIEFAKRKFVVTGVDRTKSFLEKAEQRFNEAKLTSELIQADMREFVRKDSFDVVLSMMTSFSYFNKKDNKLVLENIFQSLKRGGKFVFESMGKEVLARIFNPRHWVEKNGVYALQERSVSENWSWMKNRWILIKDGKEKEYFVEHRIYSGTEIESLLLEVGFSKVEIYGDLDGSPYDHKAEELVAVAIK